MAVLEGSWKKGVSVIAEAGGPKHHEGTKEKEE